ncbi:peptidase S53 [Sporolactobacillus shoreae]|uniref:Peptidase S53 n=1 Tax=Sporolactobacillus shoreae TaxID=1465501 RepID=A0A4Z0GJW0_9BACL|nr:protease pro-enzyme activation domain-containing protein [Sporolactobacillus shoreae]TGA97121.1 peptidase S53 [Sporolactobacillus shoreae]
MQKHLKHVSAVILSLFLIFASVPAIAATPSTGNDSTLDPISQGTGSAILDNASYFGDLPDSTSITVDIILKASNEVQLQKYIDQTVDPGSKNYHKYLTVKQFRDSFGASSQSVKDLTEYLKNYQIDSKVYPDNLVVTATGTVGDFNKALSVNVQKAKYKGKTFHATKKGPKAPRYIARHVLAILGLSDYSSLTPNAVKQPMKLTSNAGTGPLNLDPADLIKQYNVGPLYDKGYTGKGQTIDIVTLANFNPEDAYEFWKEEGITTKPGRINVKPIDGGSDYNGYEETSLDVEQSGALAPQADINVYVGPNTDPGFVDAFASAINENEASQISVSWGLSETAIAAGVQQQIEDPAYAQVFNQLFEQAASQGISMFASAGDAGAYDATRDTGTYNLAVDNPADSPYITAAGGTTLPWSYTTRTGVNIDVTKERAWGWDYLYPYFDSLGLNNPDGWLNYYFVGGGGGFSTIFKTPDFQKGVSGVNRFTAVEQWQPSSDFSSVTRPATPQLVTGSGTGRNLPDVSLNADPYTGYKVYLSDPGEPGTNAGYVTFGGTSVVSPQLAGLTALMNSDREAPIGFWNDQIYRFAKGYNSPFHPLNSAGSDNDNLFFTGTPGTIYNQSTGLGTIDFTKLDQAFSNR